MEEKVEGVMKRYLFPQQPSEGQFCGVVMLKPDKTTFIAKGAAPFVKGGRYLLTGHWETNAKGTAFVFSKKEEHITSTEGIMRSLIERVAGVGPATAKKITETLGSNALAIIDADPTVLKNFLPDSKAMVAINSYLDSRSLKEVIAELSTAGISSKVAAGLYKKYKAQTLDVIRTDPYSMVQYLGFSQTEKIGQRENIPPDNVSRLAAVLWNVLRQAENSGHTCLPLPELQKKSKLDAVLFKTALKKAADSGLLFIYQKPGGKNLNDIFIYLSTTEAKERRLILNLQKALTADTHNVTNVEDGIKWFEEKNHFELAPEQKNAVKTALSHAFAVITGGPGTGKTTIINCIRSVFKKDFPDAKILLCAPTGKAARRMTESTGNEACTLHHALSIQASDEEFDRVELQTAKMLDYDMVIIDEVSMIDLEIMDIFMSAVVSGCKVVMIGDVDQLPSVGAGAVLNDLIASGKIPVAKLIKVYRQAGDSSIALNAKFIRNGKLYLDYDDTFQFIPRATYEDSAREMVQEFLKAVEVDGIDNVCMLTPRRTEDTPTGSEALNLAVHDLVNPPAESKPELKVGRKNFRVGDKVMNLRNGKVANGEIGYIVDIKVGTEKPFSIDFDGRIIEMSMDDMAHLTFGYAMTVHKSQGSEYATVIMTLQNEHKIMLKRNLFYTGVTRAKKKFILIGNKDAVNTSILTGMEEDRRCTLLAYRLQRAIS